MLIPKGQSTTSLNDFQPILSVGTIYKVISKMIADLSTTTLPPLISKNQTVFIKSRQISNNIALTPEFSKDFNSKSSSRRALISVDFTKDFDSDCLDVMDHMLEKTSFTTISEAYSKNVSPRCLSPP